MRDLHKDDATWVFSSRFAQLKAARYWGRTPDEWDAKPQRVREEMYASWQADMTMLEWEDHLQELRLDAIRAGTGE